jgi:protein gp37
MFSFITKTWNPIGGECHIRCSYCWARKFIKRNEKLKEKYSGKARVFYKEMVKNFNDSDFVFVSDMRDMFEPNVPTTQICDVIQKVVLESPTKFLFLTKNPARYHELILPDNCIAGATIETDYGIERQDRIEAMKHLAYSIKMVSIEPIMDFSKRFGAKITEIKPQFVAVGYDNYENKLPEPSLKKTQDLIAFLRLQGITVYEKTLRETISQENTKGEK